MHHSRLSTLVIDCRSVDLKQATDFWSQALGKPIVTYDSEGDGKYAELATLADEPIILLQRVEHESRVHLDIETDDIPAEVARLEKLGATVVKTLERWVVMQAPSGQRFCVVRVQRPLWPKDANTWD